ncbi:hypothetical protein A3K70_02005 [Candidatus Bathyarchaeota archaeon RBG_16_48_13]|nr:MAG: hypothetical protein A3K70_02005 [Candidatus Bathyarchaeota archaeon RBG_16_48_13]
MVSKEEKILMEYKKLYVPAISDAMDRLGLRQGFMSQEIRPICPLNSVATKIVGYACTIKVAESREAKDSDLLEEFKAFESIKKNSAVVLDGGGTWVSSLWGQLLSTEATRRGAAGAVVDGPVRDTQTVTQIGFPVFARGFVPSSSRNRMKFVGCDITVTCGGVRVSPGDLVMADIDGVVVVPKARIEAVLDEAKKVAEDDVWVLGQIKSGRTLAEIEREKPVP